MTGRNLGPCLIKAVIQHYDNLILTICCMQNFSVYIQPAVQHRQRSLKEKGKPQQDYILSLSLFCYLSQIQSPISKNTSCHSCVNKLLLLINVKIFEGKKFQEHNVAFHRIAFHGQSYASTNSSLVQLNQQII